MSTDIFKAPKLKKPPMKRGDTEGWSSARKKKIKNRFLSFCDIVLEYTQYEHMKHEELRTHSTSPLDSGGSTAESCMSDSLSSYNTEDESLRSRMVPPRFLSSSTDGQPMGDHRHGRADDSFESVTCFCRKPFAGRPMIECNKCLTWIHLSCAKIRRNNIPDEFTCQKCREMRSKKRKSNRMRIDKLASPAPPVLTAMS